MEKIQANKSSHDKLRLAFTVALTIAVCFLVFRSFRKVEPDIVRVEVNAKEIQKAIDNAIDSVRNREKIIHTYEKIVYNKNAVDKLLLGFQNDMGSILDSVRMQRDTSRIVPLQDSIIKIQDKRIGNLSEVIDFKDSIISEKDNIIGFKDYMLNSKDTLLSISKAENKRLKRQRNGLFVVSLIEAGIIIFK